MSWLFTVAAIVVAACSSRPTVAPITPPPPPPDAAIDAALEAPPDAAVSQLGGACRVAGDCAPGQTCLNTPGGYCSSRCDTAPCGGTCVDTARGELCMSRCQTDDDCRPELGYVCDPHWRACMLPNTAAIVPRDCGTPAGLGRDPLFAPTTRLSDATSGAYQVEPAAVVLDDGSVLAMFTNESGLEAVRIDAANRLQTTAVAPDRLRRGGHPPADPTLARDGTTVYAAWRSTGATREVVLARSSDRGATWSPPVAVHEPGDCVDRPDCLDKPRVIVGPDPQKKRAIVYVAYVADGLRIRASHDGGTTFGPARTALVGGVGGLAVDARGVLYAVGLDGGPHGAYGSGDQRVQFTASVNGGASFAAPRQVSRTGEQLPFYFAAPAIAVDAARKWIYIAYVRGGRDARWDIALVASKDHGKTWSRTKISDEPACAIHMLPQLAVDPVTGTLHIAWYDSRGLRFAHATCQPGALRCRQVGRINDEPFAALTTVRLGPRWLGDREALLVDPARRTLHAVWTQPVPRDDGGVASRIFHARARLPLR